MICFQLIAGDSSKRNVVTDAMVVRNRYWYRHFQQLLRIIVLITITAALEMVAYNEANNGAHLSYSYICCAKIKFRK